MTKQTRGFLFVATGILVVGLGTGLVASYMGGLQGLTLIGGNGPAELAYVPSDAHMVGFANVRDVMDSELRQKLMLLQPGTAEGADQFQQATGINIQTDVDVIVASMSGANSPNQRPLLLARGRFDSVRIESLARDKGAVIEEYKGRRLIVHGESDMGVVFVEPNLAAVGTPASLRKAIDTKDGGANVTDNAEIMRLVKDIDDGNAWAVVRFDALTGGQQLPADLARQLPPVNWFAASGHVNGGIRGTVHAEAKDEASATALRDVIRGFIALARLQTGERAEFADLMNSLQLGGQGTTVSLAFAVPPEMIDALGALHARRPAGPAEAPNSVPSPELPAPAPSAL
jgi:hypothetical protein